jgi:uncharacterized protein with HEPN domain
LSKDITIYLNDILDNIKRAEDFAGVMTYGEMISDIKTSYAVVRCLEIIGEATNRLPKALREKYPEVPWSKIVSMRNLIIHDYSAVDYLTVWQTLKESLPELKPQIQKILADLK